MDDSGCGLSAVLSQSQSLCETKSVIAYASRTLSKCEKNYSSTEKECLTAIWVVLELRPYRYGTPFTIIMDRHALCWLTSLDDLSTRLNHWSLKLQEFYFNVAYEPVKRRLDVDGLSCCSLQSPSVAELLPSQQLSDSVAMLNSMLK